MNNASFVRCRKVVRTKPERTYTWAQKKKKLKVHFLEEPLWTVGETGLFMVRLITS